MKTTPIIAALAIILSIPAAVEGATLKGEWLFNNSGNLGLATVGTDLTITGTPPAFSATMADDFATPQTGVVTTVLGAASGFTATHNILPNGGGSFVNDYTIMTDIFSPVGSRSSWRTIYQTNTGNTNDGDYFIRNDTDQMGTASMTYTTNPINEAKWTRLVVSFHLDPVAANSVITTYLDGSLFYTHASGSGELVRDGRFSLDPTVLFFADNDGDNAPLNVGSLAIWDGVLSAANVAALGGAGAPIPEPASGALSALAIGLVLRRRRRN